MNYNPVDRNRFQQGMNEHYRWNHAPDPYAQMEAGCVIKEVYDSDAIENLKQSGAVPGDLLEKLNRAPGYTFARVILLSGQELVLPFRQHVSQIESMYGNAESLKNKPARILYRNMDIGSGSLELFASLKRPKPLSKATSVFDAILPF